jgi:hypothetical protein
VKRWSAIINHSRMSGRPPQTAEFDYYGDLQRYLAPESEVVQITIYKSWTSGVCLETVIRQKGAANG